MDVSKPNDDEPLPKELSYQHRFYFLENKSHQSDQETDSDT